MFKRTKAEPLVDRKVETVRVTRLTQEVFEHLRKQANATCIVTSQTTELQAGFQLGVNHVLSVIAAGIVIEAP